MKNSLAKRLSKINIAIVSHIFATGPALELEGFLKRKANNLIFVGHPFSFSTTPVSFYRQYSKSKLIKSFQSIKIKLPDLLLYFKDAFLTFWWILKYPQRINLYIGSDGFVVFLGLILKKIGKVEDVILYTIDFMPKRFTNPILNRLYHYFDEQALKNCKVIWNLSDKMAEGREEYMSVKRQNFTPQLTVPLGIWDKRIPKLKFKDRNRYQLVFMGHLLKKQGLDIVIEALPIILKKVPKISLLIIGTGEYENILKQKVAKLKLQERVTFSGYVDDHQEVERMLSKSIAAVAPYTPDPDSFTYFADPGKIKNYLAAGLPVILTMVPPIAREIQDKKCAFIIDYSAENFAKIATQLLKSPKLIKEYSKNAIEYAKRFDWETIFPEALGKTLN